MTAQSRGACRGGTEPDRPAERIPRYAAPAPTGRNTLPLRGLRPHSGRCGLDDVAPRDWRRAPPFVQHAAMRQILTILAVDDVARSARFYETVFGWRRHVDVPVYVEFEVEGAPNLGVYLRGGFARNTGRAPSPPAPDATTSTELYFRVDDVGAAVARALAAGAELLSPAAARDWGDEVAYVADPDGNVLAFARSHD
jgi:predicted enzyme related to lactoylglutathione lyase